jgi:CubicO group peptidase (beta-lactamase class C family)
MSRYLQTELAGGVAPDGTRVVSEQNLHATWEQQVSMGDHWSVPPEMGNLAVGYGLGWVLGDYFGQPLIWHNGGTFGFSSLMAFLPEADLGIVVLTNVAGGDFVTWAIQYYLLEMLFAQPHGVDAVIDQLLAQMAEQRAELPAMLANVDAEAVAPYLGVYENDELGVITTELTDGALTLDSGELQSGLTPVRDESGEVSAYFLADPPLAGVMVTFSMEDDVPVLRFADPETGEEFVFQAAQ